jgi:hypothetical protein
VKTLINQHGDVCRHDDGEAEKVIALNYGWDYCPKIIFKRGVRGEEAKSLQAEAKERQAQRQASLS